MGSSIGVRIHLIVFLMLLSLHAKAQNKCIDLFQDTTPLAQGDLVKTRSDHTHIFKIQSANETPHYFKERPTSQSFERQIFDDLEMPVEAFRVAHSFGLDSNVPDAQLEDGFEMIVNGQKIKTREGLLQNGMSDLVTPIDEFKMKHQGREPSAKDIQQILNQGDWPRIYANWKIFWTIFMQADLNIANLARHGQDLYMFDTGDLLNLPAVRTQVGIAKPQDNFDFNMPDRSYDRVHHRPDLRRADSAYKRIAIEIANESEEKTAARLGKSLDDSFLAPRGKVRDHVRAMKAQARWISSLLDKSPFDY